MTLILQFRKSRMRTAHHAWLNDLLAAPFLFFPIKGLLWLRFFTVVRLRVL